MMIPNTLKTKKYLIRAIGGTVLSLVLVFVVSNVFPMIRGVNLSLEGLTNGALYSDGVISLSGFAKHATHLTINGRELPVTRDGSFEDVLVLLPGYNVITVKASDKFGNVSEKKYEVIKRNTDIANDTPINNQS